MKNNTNKVNQFITNKHNKLNYSTLTTVLIFIFSVVAVFFLSNHNTNGNDVYWHLRIGSDSINSFQNPWVDHYSFTHYGQEVLNVPIFFNIILAGFVEMFGVDIGFILTRIFFYTLLFISLTYIFRKLNISNYGLLFATVIILVLLSFRPLIRPEISSYFLIILSIYVTLKTIQDFSTKNLISSILLLLLWSNHHGGVIGYLIISASFVQRGLQILIDKKYDQIVSYGGWGMAALAIGFLTFNGIHPIYDALTIDPVLKHHIKEYSGVQDIVNNTFSKMFYSAFYVFTSIFSLYLLLSKRYGLAFLLVILLIQSFMYVRLFVVCGIISSILITLVIGEELKQQNISRKVLRSLSVTMILALITCIPLISSNHYTAINKKPAYTQGIINHIAVNYPKDKPINILTTYGSGGFFLAFLPQNFKLYIDGRSHILYSVNFYMHFLRMITSLDGVQLSKEIEKYDIEFLVLENSWKSAWVAYNAGFKEIAFLDNDLALYTRDEQELTQFARDYIFPQCISKDEPVKVEATSLLQNVSTYSYMQQVKDFYIRYSNNTNNISFESIKNNINQLDDKTIRYFAYLAKLTNKKSDSLFLFREIRKKTHGDMFNIIQILADMGDYIAASELTRYLSTNIWLEEIKERDQKDYPAAQVQYNWARFLEQHLGNDEDLKALMDTLVTQYGITPHKASNILDLEMLRSDCQLFNH